jgi:hypothetical protein
MHCKIEFMKQVLPRFRRPTNLRSRDRGREDWVEIEVDPAEAKDDFSGGREDTSCEEFGNLCLEEDEFIDETVWEDDGNAPVPMESRDVFLAGSVDGFAAPCCSRLDVTEPALSVLCRPPEFGSWLAPDFPVAVFDWSLSLIPRTCSL